MIEVKSVSADIFVYGDITSDKWTDEDTTAKSFVDALNAFDGKDVTVHVNSAGGDVFAALAIHNAMQNYKGNVTVSIDGLAASAASLIACGADKIVMASNALMMIHMPSVMLGGSYTADDLEKVQATLTAVKTAIVSTYRSRINRAQSPLAASIDVSAMLQSETWFNARDALKWGFVDEVAEPVDLKIDNVSNMMIVNSLRVDMKKFDEEKLRRAMEVKNMTNTTVTTTVEKTAPVVDVAAIRAQEVGRIRALMKLRGTNKAVDALVDVALEDGKTVEEIQKYVDAVKDLVAPTPIDAAEKICGVITDHMNSGAEGVTGDPVPANKLSAQQNAIVNFANGGK